MLATREPVKTMSNRHQVQREEAYHQDDNGEYSDHRSTIRSFIARPQLAHGFRNPNDTLSNDDQGEK
jgi:hypothetical protein